MLVGVRREGGEKARIPSRLGAVTTEADVGLILRNHEFMT